MIPNLSSIVKNTTFSSLDKILKRCITFGKHLIKVIHITRYYGVSKNLRLMMHTIMIINSLFRDVRLKSITSIGKFRKGVRHIYITMLILIETNNDDSRLKERDNCVHPIRLQCTSFEAHLTTNRFYSVCDSGQSLDFSRNRRIREVPSSPL